MTLLNSPVKGIDFPIWQQMRSFPITPSSGNDCVNDDRGTNRYIYYILNSSTSGYFWRYDVWNDAWQPLADPPAFTFAAGTAMAFDPSKGTSGYVWLFAPSSSTPYAVFSYYDIATNTWTAQNVPAGLSAQWGTDAALVHTCSAINAPADDNALYLIGNNSTTWYKFSISGNSWSTITPILPATPGAGCELIWTHGFSNSDRLYVVMGNTTSSIYHYTISTTTFSDPIAYAPSTDTFTTGTILAYDADKRIYIQKDSTKRIYCYQLEEDKVYPFATVPYSMSSYIGGGMLFVKSETGEKFLYVRTYSSEFKRLEIFW